MTPIFCMIPNGYPELYEAYAEGRMLAKGSELGKQLVRLANKLSSAEEDKEKAAKKKFSLFG